MEIEQTPIYLVAGFLGSGKTTLVKELLEAGTRVQRIGVIRNEFVDQRDTTFEAPLLLNDDDEEYFRDFVELPSTCVCCTARTRLTDCVNRLAERGIEEGNPFKIILAELNGLSDVTAVVDDFLSNRDAKSDSYRLDGLLYVADVNRILTSTITEAERAPMAMSTHVVLNKMDLLDKSVSLDAFENELRTANQDLSCQRTVRGRDVTVDWIMQNKWWIQRVAENAKGQHTHQWMKNVTPTTVFFDGAKSPKELEEQLSRFLWDLDQQARRKRSPPEGGDIPDTTTVPIIYRCALPANLIHPSHRIKGFCRGTTHPNQWLAVQAVGSSVEIEEISETSIGSDTRCRLLVVGENVSDDNPFFSWLRLEHSQLRKE